MNKKFVVVSSPFDENSGGRIALHRLCDLLNKSGEEAYLWPLDNKVICFKQPLRSIDYALRLVYRSVKRWIKNEKYDYHTFDQFNTPIAKKSDLKNAIIIYPEIVSGNPLCAENIVRWFLNKPGVFTGQVNYGENELYFFYQEAFNDESINPNRDNLLQTSFLRDDIYKKKNFGHRTGSCYILRKGHNRKLEHDISNSIIIDNLSHENIVEVFNTVEICISYDLYTMYSHYAALCGCISIVVPEKGLSKEEWQSTHEFNKYGIAYGFEDIEHAIKTQPLVLPFLKEQEVKGNETVKNFISKCEKFFTS